MAQTVKQFTQSDSHLLTIKEAADFLRISRRSLFYLISKGRLQAVRLSPRMTRISLHELQQLTESAFVASASSFTHKTHYTMAEVMSKFNIKYGRLYEIRNRYQLASIHAWGTTAFRKKDVEKAIAKYNEEQGKAQQEAYYTCFDIMQKYGLGKTQVRRFAETHGVRIKKAKGGRANLYLKADWVAARKKAEKISASTKAKRT